MCCANFTNRYETIKLYILLQLIIINLIQFSNLFLENAPEFRYALLNNIFSKSNRNQMFKDETLRQFDIF